MLAAKGEALAALAYLQFFVGDTQRAFDNAAAALALSQAAGNRRGAARALSVMGETYYGFGDIAKAVEIQEQALSLWREVNDVRGEAQSLMYLGYVYAPLSETSKALAAYHRALFLWRTVKESRGEALTLTALGVLQNKLGDKQEALNSYLQARELLRPTGDRPSMAIVLANIAVVYRGLGEEQRALEYLGQALALFQSIGDRWGTAETQLEIGRVYYLLGESQKALNSYLPALTTFHQLVMPRLEAQTLRDIGLVHDALGDKDRALENYKESLQLTRAGLDDRDAAYTLNYMGRVYEGLGRQREALDYYRQALPLARAFGDRFAESLAFYNMAGAQRGLGELIEARATVQSALGIVESVRTKVASQELRASYFASVRQYDELLIDVLMMLHRQQPSGGFEAEALVASERARARSLIDLLAEARADVREGVDEALLEREHSLEQQLDAAAERQARLLSGKHTREGAAALDKELVALTAAYEETRNQIQARSPRYAALTQVQPLGIVAIQELLDDRTLLLEYALGDERSYLWVATRSSLTSRELPRRTELEGAARLVYNDDLRARQPRLGETPEEYGARVREADAQVPATCCGAEPDGAGAGRRPAWRQAIAYRGRGGPAVHPLRRLAGSGCDGTRAVGARASCSTHGRSRNRQPAIGVGACGTAARNDRASSGAENCRSSGRSRLRAGRSTRLVGGSGKQGRASTSPGHGRPGPGSERRGYQQRWVRPAASALLARGSKSDHRSRSGGRRHDRDGLRGDAGESDEPGTQPVSHRPFRHTRTAQRGTSRTLRHRALPRGSGRAAAERLPTAPLHLQPRFAR